MMENSHKLVESNRHVFWHGRYERATVKDLEDYGIEDARLLTGETCSTEQFTGINYNAFSNRWAVRENELIKEVPLVNPHSRRLVSLK